MAMNVAIIAIIGVMLSVSLLTPDRDMHSGWTLPETGGLIHSIPLITHPHYRPMTAIRKNTVHVSSVCDGQEINA